MNPADLSNLAARTTTLALPQLLQEQVKSVSIITCSVH
jgi:hypothetical protein